jgi:hypothetical protein
MNLLVIATIKVLSIYARLFGCCSGESKSKSTKICRIMKMNTIPCLHEMTMKKDSIKFLFEYFISIKT